MDSFPVEIFDQILENLKLTEVLKLRLVSKRWENIVASFNSRKIKSLALFRDHYIEVSYYTRVSTSDHLFGAVKVESFPKIALPTLTTALTKDFTQSVLRLFPNIEHLAFRAPLDLSSATNLASLLNHWKNISTLSLVTNAYPKEFKIPIAAAINGLTGLIRLDLRLHFDTSLLSPTLARIHHLSLGFELEEKELLEVFRQIGPHCTRLWVKPRGFVSRRLSISNLQSWMRANVKLFSRLTHFGCKSFIDNDGMKFIDTHFTSLHVWYIAGETHGSFAEMGHISRLDELRVLHAFCFLPVIGAAGTNVTEPMRNVTFFELCWNYFWMIDSTEGFCTQLAWLLPKVEHMILTFHQFDSSEYDELVEIIKKNMFMFKNLRTCQLRFRYEQYVLTC